jgi:ligand-binding sensor domain-containing protein
VRDGKAATLSIREGLPSNAVLAIAEDREGSLWVGTESGGLSRLTDRVLTAAPLPDPVSDQHISRIWGAPDGVLWVATLTRGLFMVGRDGRVQRWPTVPCPRRWSSP